jgi:hypothetical protein
MLNSKSVNREHGDVEHKSNNKNKFKGAYLMDKNSLHSVAY